MHVMRYGFVVTMAAAAAVLAGIAGFSKATVEAQSRGKAVYDAHCVECHGASGKGDGASAAYLVPRPRDFTTGKYKIRSTESGTMPSDAARRAVRAQRACLDRSRARLS